MALNIKSIERRINSKDRDRKEDTGWRLFSCPETGLQNPRVVFLGLNPGGDEEISGHGKLFTNKGSAYVVESWKNKPAGTENLQIQVRELFATIGERPVDVLSGNLVPFRSRSWDGLKKEEQEDFLRFGSEIWEEIFKEISPQVVISMGVETRKAVDKILNVDPTDHGCKIGWKPCRGYKKYFGENGIHIGLPHLSRFKIFSREECKQPISNLLKECVSKKIRKKIPSLKHKNKHGEVKGGGSNAKQSSIEGRISMFQNLDKLTTAQVGKYGEYLVKMELTQLGYDVFSADIDDKGIDFLLRVDGKKPKYFDAQVKTIRKKKLPYVFMKKSKFPIRKNNLLFLVMLGEETGVEIFLIRSTVWEKPNDLFVSNDYPKGKSAPEWGIRLALKRLSELERFRLTPKSKL